MTSGLIQALRWRSCPLVGKRGELNESHAPKALDGRSTVLPRCHCAYRVAM